jgi:hypothetical protein
VVGRSHLGHGAFEGEHVFPFEQNARGAELFENGQELQQVRHFWGSSFQIKVDQSLGRNVRRFGVEGHTGDAHLLQVITGEK